MADDTIIDRADRAGSASKRNFELLPGTRFRPEPIRWLWPQWLARGKLQLLAGSAGTGKTTISVALAAAVTTGAAWPDGGRSEVGDVLFWSGEDGIADTLVPRFLAAGGDLSRLHFAGEVTEGRRRRTFDPVVDQVAAVVQRIRDDREIRRVDDVARLVGGSLRALQRLFSEYVGVSPKWVIRRYRLHEITERLAAGGPVDWAGLAAELGYADQAHLVRDFRAMVGETPTWYAQRY